eukprot:gnl/MRDRNA2_/MRDRNA2_66422_c0_seq1.p1 gnl/MRDRNA2_/MRDRNA2_66422_c0~~gnl/MRDRNA2_/MRDRNA2_66422_c0_seq1.p1  ORF type:complete len:184 (+),score=39.87 gnl/MRDRNA2_/MRDRNA2_66422_c0_seq1:62-613(+)
MNHLPKDSCDDQKSDFDSSKEPSADAELKPTVSDAPTKASEMKAPVLSAKVHDLNPVKNDCAKVSGGHIAQAKDRKIETKVAMPAQAIAAGHPKIDKAKNGQKAEVRPKVKVDPVSEVRPYTRMSSNASRMEPSRLPCIVPLRNSKSVSELSHPSPALRCLQTGGAVRNDALSRVSLMTFPGA